MLNERPHYHSPGCIIWEVKDDHQTYTLSASNRSGFYPYRVQDNNGGHISQLTLEEAIWKTLEFCPNLLEFVR